VKKLGFIGLIIVLLLNIGSICNAHYMSYSPALAVRTATVVVAASDASAKSKAQADYVCDGTDDQVEIQAAIDAINADGGGHIVLSEGLFSITTAITFANKSNVWLSGQGKSTHIRADAGLGTNGVINIRTPTSHIIVSDLYVDTNGANANYAISIRGDNASPPGTEFVIVQRVWIEDGNDDGIEIIDSAQNVKILDSYFIGTFSDSPIEVGDGATNITIRGNHIDCVANDGISVNSHTDPGTAPSQVVIDGNHITYTTGGGLGAIVIGGDVAFADITIVNNQIRNTPDDGIVVQFFSDKPYISRLLLANNNIHNVGRYGIYVRYGNDVVVKGNLIYSAASESIYVRDSLRTSIIGNTVVDGAANGISLSTTIRTTITGNLVEGCAYRGLNFAGNENNIVVVGNICTGNDKGIGFLSSAVVTTAIIANNDITGNSGNWWEQAGSTLSGVSVKNNKGYITENSGTATITAGDTSVDVTHGLAATPTRVQLTPTTDTAGKRYWVSAKGDTTFTITIDSSHTADISFDWRAVVGEGN